jgi:AcrR family transcriptional regulator
MPDAYHHGNLRRLLLDEAAEVVASAGPAALSLRELARSAGVSHGAPAHHFGSRRGLLTALAAEGFALMAADLSAHLDDFREMGVTFVRWALAHPGHYAVMFAPDLVDPSDADLAAARAEAWRVLGAGASARRGDDDPHAGGDTAATAPSGGVVDHGDAASDDRIAEAWAAFSLVHGLASLWLSGALPVPNDPDAAARAVTGQLFDGRGAG